ncbi:glycoside hydrolase domain-containing protein [Pedobacter frigoris]|uniref:Glycoside hydrolase 123-like N-terminal domain-containing protein n=1 Tax=Pedobacter frigoris TaxID=2571272 RepID=A0A4U1CIF6_9SPHI|nr:glycoside hydrolase domain-containing protein [Pedobacter frigoris]TKC07197.1 hypothetical protein FA047_08030 [Pedobacter frigoris]
MKFISTVALYILFGISAYAQEMSYTISKQLWPDVLGNHRAVISVGKNTDAAEVKIEWRRRDWDADQKAIIITDEKGNKIDNIYRIHINSEEGHFVFQPTGGAGKYFVYYYAWSGRKGNGGFSGNYLKKEKEPNEDWVEKNNLTTSKLKLEQAKVIEIQSRTAFDSFFPMEIVAKKSEVENLVKKSASPYLVFPEDRKFPIKMFDDIPYKWVTKGSSALFTGTAQRNEYYVFQLGVFALVQDLENIKIEYIKSPFSATCFNTEGYDSKGDFFTKIVNVKKGKVQPLWIGLDIPKDAKPGLKEFQVKVKPENAPAKIINVKINVTNEVLANRGDDESWRHSRLRWLNSKLGINDDVVKPYRSLEVTGQKISTSSGQVTLKQDGLPSEIMANGNSLLAGPLTFNILMDNQAVTFSRHDFRFLKKEPGKVTWESTMLSDKLKLTCRASMEADGYLRYKISVAPLHDTKLDDIRLQVPVKKELARYFMGMGLPGSKCPDNYDWKWKGPQDSYWIGDVDAGLFCEMRGASYSGPLLNLYHPAAPPAWYNNNLGGFNVSEKDNVVNTQTYSGTRTMKAGETLDFEFAMLITPVKPLDTKSQFVNRYYHNGNQPEPPLSILESGVKIINVHHANLINPYINYPFGSVDSIKRFVSDWHKRGVKTKIYYTIRELSNQATELWALRSLGTEVLADGNGGGYTWLREHLGSNYNAQWFTPINGMEACDAAVLTSGESRWYNYYVEGLRWMIRNTDLDGLYLDDVSFDRDLLKRVRKVMDMVKPGCILDLHSNTGFSRGPATQYMEFFPYINKLWFGESFQYDKMPPENWLVEVSGIPYGLMGDMLHAGGNPWRGMVYGMTVRYPWFTEGVNCDPREIWKVWDSFGIADAKMVGYWEEQTPVRTSDPGVLATAYIKDDKLLIAVASWNKNATAVKLNIDWKKIGWEPQEIMICPAIENFQSARTLGLKDAIEIDPTKGYLLIINKIVH